MKIKKIVSLILAALTATSCLCFYAFASDNAAKTPLILKITAAGNDQRCTKKDDVTDNFGRKVQQIIPMDSQSSISPAWFSDSANRQAQIDSGYAYSVVKFVYYVSGTTANVPTLNTWSYKNNQMTGCGAATPIETSAPQSGKWNTAYFSLPDSAVKDVFYAFMFAPYGSDSAKSHLNDIIYIGYIGLFDTYENAKSHVSDFEGEFVLSGITVDNVEIDEFSLEKVNYSYDLNGADGVPNVGIKGVGNSNSVRIENVQYNSANGTAQTEITVNSTVYKISFTGGATATNVEPKRIYITNAGSDQGSSGKADVEETFGRTVQQIYPMENSSKTFSPATFMNVSSDYRVVKFVYYTSDQAKPSSLSVWTNSGGMAARGSAKLHKDSTVANGEGWNVAYYDLATSSIDFSAGESLYAYMFSPYGSDAASAHKDDTVYIGYIGLFGSIVDAKAHVSDFEGDVKISEVSMNNDSLGNGEGIYNYDAAKASAVPKLTVKATGNTDKVTVTNGKYDTNGNAISTVSVGDDVIITVNITNGNPKEIIPAVMNFEWHGAEAQGVAGVETVTDDFSRSFKKFAPALTYYKDGSDLVPTVPVSPGGSATSILPENMETSDYKAVKIVVRSNENYAPRLRVYGSENTVKAALNSDDFKPDEWCVLYYEINGLTMYQLNFTSDASPNHSDGVFEVAYAAMFGSIESAKNHKSDFEGDFSVTDVMLNGSSVGDVPVYQYDLNGADYVPKLTVKATGNTKNVIISNGVIDENGNAVSTVKNGNSVIVTVIFNNGDTTFKITDILINGESIGSFSAETKEYTLNLGFAAPQPIVTYTHQGENIVADISTQTVSNDKTNTVLKYITTIKQGADTLYEITFNVDQTKPEALLNTLYKLNNDKKLTVAYFGGSVTSGTGSSNSNVYSWRAVTRDWLKERFPQASVTEVNAAIGGTGAIFGVFRNQKQVISSNPDLVFLEMCINDSYDGTYSDNSYIRYAESIIKQLYAANPKVDIIIVVTGDYGALKSEPTSNTPVYGAGYTALSEYYDLPIIYVGRELVKTIYTENGGSYPSGTTADVWKKYYMDGVHPTDKGYAHYAKTITDYLEPNLPSTYTPLASEYADKKNPQDSYSVSQNLGSVMIDADMVSPADFAGNKYLGGFSATSGSGFYESALKSSKEGDTVSFEFNSSNIGIWTWSYGTSNGKNGTDIKYSVDAGEIKTANIYRSYPNHRIYFLAEGLDNSKKHTIRIYHCDGANSLDIYRFLLWDIADGQNAQMSVVPYFDFEAEDFSVTLNGEKYTDFNPKVTKYEIPVELTDGEDYPKIGFNVRSDYYGYEINQASGENNIAELIVDNVGKYVFEFVNGNAVEILSVKNSNADKADGTVTFAQKTSEKLQLKKSSQDWSSATEHSSSITEITGLEPGVYNIRYVFENGIYGFTQTFRVRTIFSFENIYYVSENGTGDGTSAEKAANAGTDLATVVSNAATYFGNKAQTETCHIVFAGDVFNMSAQQVNTALFKNLVITSDADVFFRVYSSICFSNVTAASGKITFKDISVVLGNPNASKGKHNDEIFISAYANELEFDNFKITDFATNNFGEKRTSTFCLNYYHDGASGVEKGLGKAVTVNTSGNTFGTLRVTGYNSGDENGNAYFVLNNGNVGTFKLGGHCLKETVTGVVKGEINGGTVSNLLVSGDEATINVGTVAAIINGGNVAQINVTSAQTANEDAVDRVVIFNNNCESTVSSNKIDYIIKSANGGKANIETDSEYRLSAFVFTTEKENVIIDKGTEDEIVLKSADGAASVSVSRLKKGNHTVDYENEQLPEGVFKLEAVVKLARASKTSATETGKLKLLIQNSISGEYVQKIELESSNSQTDENGNVSVSVNVDMRNINCQTVNVYIVKNGYLPIVAKNVPVSQIESLFKTVSNATIDMTEYAGDIKSDYDAEFGDGIVDIDDFIRIIKGFSLADKNENYKKAADIDENGVINVADLSFIKKNFGKKAYEITFGNS